MSGKFLLVSPAQSFLHSGPYGIQDYIFVLSNTLRISKWGFLFDERRGLNNTGHSPSKVGDSSEHSLTGPLLHTLTHTHTHTHTQNFTQPVYSLDSRKNLSSTLLSLHIEYLIRHVPHRKHRVRQSFYSCMCNHCRGNVSSEPLLSNGSLIWLHYSSF
jgi:hypothetical protein